MGQGIYDTRRAGHQAGTAAPTAVPYADAVHSPPSTEAVDRMIRAMGQDVGAYGPPTQAVDPASHREGQIQAIGKIQETIFGTVRDGINLAMPMIERAELPREVDRGLLGDLIALGASVALYGTGAAVGVGVSAALAIQDRATAKFVESSVKETIKHAFAPLPNKAPADVHDLKAAFEFQLGVEQRAISNRFGAAWSSLHDRLAGLAPAELDAALVAAQAIQTMDTAKILGQIVDRTLIAWTNFLARASHGAMGGWDSSERNGSKRALALHDAAAPPERPGQDPTRDNVDPAAMDPLLALHQRPGREEHFGILEVFVDAGGRLLDTADYRMRLDHVGPEVRRRISQLGRVGDLPVNKLVRIASPGSSPPLPIASMLITADGYVRNVNWGKLQNMSIRHHAPPGVGQLLETHACMTDLVHGASSADCHLAPERDAVDIQRIAEAVQNLSLHDLEA